MRIDPQAALTEWIFDLGATLQAFPYEDDEGDSWGEGDREAISASDDMWTFFMPGKQCLSYRPDGYYRLGPSDGSGGCLWRPVV